MRSNWRTCVVWALLAATGAGAAQEPSRPSPGSPLDLLAVPADGVAYYERLSKATALYESGQWAAAGPLLEQLVRDYPRDAQTWVMLGRTQFQLGKPQQAAIANRQAGERLGWDLGTPLGYRLAMNQFAAGDKRAGMQTLRWMIFDNHGFWRSELFDRPEFAALRTDPAFLALVGKPDTSGWTREHGWRHDIDFLVEEVKRVNPVYRDRPLPAELLQRQAQLKAQVSILSDDALFFGMKRMLAPLQQGHVFLFSYPGNRYLPVRFYAFPEGLHIVEASDAEQALVGARVLRIGTLTAEEALQRLAASQSMDGPMESLWGVSMLAETANLRGMGAIDAGDPVTLTVQTADGETRTVALGTSDQAPTERQDRLVAPRGVQPPLFLSQLQRTFWTQPMPEAAALYVQVNNLLDQEDQTLAQFGKTLWTRLQDDDPANLILDLRHNNGGNTLLYPQLLRTLVAFTRQEGKRFYVLIGRRTYSAAGNFVTDLERLTDPVFVGEATSECCNLHGDPISVRLPYSGVEGELTAVKWNLSTPFDGRRELSPEVPVQLTAEAYFAGRDPVMEAVLRMIDRTAAAAIPPTP